MKSLKGHMPFKFTMAYTKSRSGKGYFGMIEELPGAASQGDTIDELRENLYDAISSLFESNKREKKNMDSFIKEELPF